MKQVLLILTISSILMYSVHTLTAKPTTIAYTYTITEVSNNEYYGKSTEDDTGIYFTSDMLKGESIAAGDTITAYFANDNEDSLISVKKN